MKDKVRWGWEFYKALGYRITEDADQEEALNNFIDEIIQEAKRERTNEILLLLKAIDDEDPIKVIEHTYNKTDGGKE